MTFPDPGMDALKAMGPYLYQFDRDKQGNLMFRSDLGRHEIEEMLRKDKTLKNYKLEEIIRARGMWRLVFREPPTN